MKVHIKSVSILAVSWHVLAAVSAVMCGPAAAADVRVLAPNATKEPVLEAATAFEKATGHKVTIGWTGSEAIAKRISEGEVVDIVVNTVQNIDRLIADGRLAQGSRTDFAKSSIGVAVGASAPRPDVSTIGGVKAALLAAKSVAISSGPSGRYLYDLFGRLGVAEQMKDRVKQPPSGAQIADLLASGEADLGFQQVSELLHAKGIQYLGPLPAEIQSYTVWSGAIHSHAPQAEAARSFLKALRTPETAAAVTKFGMEPM